MSTFRIQIDATNPELPFRNFLITEVGQILDATIRQSVVLESGKNFHFQIQSGVLPDWTFRVNENGNVEYNEEFDITRGGFLAGRGTASLTLLGYEITLDARALSGGSVAMNVLGEKFGFISLKTFRMLPQRNYLVIQGSGTTADFPFAVTLPTPTSQGGVFDYDPQFDVCNSRRGFAAGKRTTLLRLLGYPIFINACAAGVPVISNVQQIQVNEVQLMTLLPGTGNYELVAVRGVGIGAHLAFFLDRTGNITTVSVDPPSDPLSLQIETVSRPGLKVLPRKSNLKGSNLKGKARPRPAKGSRRSKKP